MAFGQGTLPHRAHGMYGGIVRSVALLVEALLDSLSVQLSVEHKNNRDGTYE